MAVVVVLLLTRQVLLVDLAEVAAVRQVIQQVILVELEIRHQLPHRKEIMEE
jgi:hypothetical protein